MLSNSKEYLNVDELAEKYYYQHVNRITRSTDKKFKTLLIIEWFFGILISAIVSPRTWEGELSSIHIHLYTSVILGAIILFPPIILIHRKPGFPYNKYVVSCSQCLFASLIIHLMGGRLEAHFFIFGSLAFLSAYRSWKVLIPATVIVAVDHLIRGILWPESVYGVLGGAEWRWIEHAAWVLFEDIFLFFILQETVKDMHNIAKHQAQLELYTNHIEEIVKEKSGQLEIEKSKLIHASKLASLGEMAGGIAHEINNPLAIISISTFRLNKVVKKGLLTPEIAMEVVNTIDKTVIRMKNIVNGMRNITRKTNQGEKEFVLLKEILQDTIGLCSERFKIAGVDLQFDLSTKEFSTNIKCNRVQISQVFLNLLGNSFDAIENNNEKWISIEPILKDDKIVIYFKDSGNGIPKDILEKIFNPFFTSKEIGKGTGIGLSISKNILEQHNGFIKYDDSCENTCFTVQLPKSG